MTKLWLRNSWLAMACAAVAAGAGNRTTPPTLDTVAPLGMSRGTTVEMTVEGLNLARASAIYFSEPGVTGRILRIKELPDLSDGCRKAMPLLERSYGHLIHELTSRLKPYDVMSACALIDQRLDALAAAHVNTDYTASPHNLREARRRAIPNA